MALTLKIKKRNGTIVDFTTDKISTAIEKAFLSVLHDAHRDEAAAISRSVSEAIDKRFGATALIPSVEDIQDLVENALMNRGYFAVAKHYIIYRYEHNKEREARKQEVLEKIESRELSIKKADGTMVPYSAEKILKTLHYVIKSDSGIDTAGIAKQADLELFDGISTKDITRTLIMVTRSMIEIDPEYSAVAARLLLASIYKETIGASNLDYTNFIGSYRSGFIRNIKESVELKKLDESILSYDLEAIADMLDPKRDHHLQYLGLQTLADRYFVRVSDKGRMLESPQYFFIRVAMGLAQNEKPEHRMQWVREFYDVMSELHYVPSTPTLFNAGSPFPQLSSCYLNTVVDDLDHIFKVYGDNAQLSKWTGGIGTDWTNLRGTGALIKKAGIHSQGVIPFLKIANDVTVAINRSGRRRGATCAYLETWHYDIEEFLELRKNTGDERRRTPDMNTANWIPDLFMKRIREDGEWTLFSPDEVPELHHIYGKAFDQAYTDAERRADQGVIRLSKRLKARDLWKKMLTQLFETGHPWITFKDASNIRSPQDHVGVVHNSNLCTEITLNTSADETAVCNLGSVNLARHVKAGAFDGEKIGRTVKTAMRMLDNVIDINFYPTKEARNSNMKHRPIGLGIMGFQDALYQLGIKFDSPECVDFADRSMEIVSYYALLGSSELAKERGAYESFKGSKWDRGILPIDTLALLESERGETIPVSRTERLDWSVVRDSIKQHGMRNSNTMAIAPTATISNISGCTPAIEPIYKNIFVKSNISGDFTVVNPYLIKDLKAVGLWDAELLSKMKYHDGSIAEILEIPEDIRGKYKETFEIDMQWLIRAAAERGKWIDQSQSLNIFFKGQSGKDLSDVYFLAWNLGLKTTYYLRTIAASQVEKSTVDTASFGSTHMRKKDDVSTNAIGSSTATPSPVSMPEMAKVIAAPLHTAVSTPMMMVASPLFSPSPIKASSIEMVPSTAFAQLTTHTSVTQQTSDAAVTPKKKYNIEIIGDAICEACE